MEIVVRIIKINPWTNITKWATCFDYIGTYLTRTGVPYTGLSKDDQERLEKELNYANGALSPHGSFWDTFAVKLGKEDLILNTERPEDELKYLFLKGHKRVATGLKGIQPGHDYVLINRNSEAEESNRLNKIKRDAYRELDKMSIEDMRKCLRLFGVKSDTISNELVEAKISEFIEATPQKFLTAWVSNPNKEIQFLIEEAIAKNVIRRNRTQYTYGTDTIANGIEEAIAYFKDKKNQDIKMAVLNEIKSK